jgi:RHS repeat-associated protein
VTYAYRYPHYGPDNRNHWSMRGFEEVITTGASGAKTTEHFGYDVDWSGRKTKVVVSSAEAPTKAHSISATTWGKKTLFAGQVEIIVETDVHAYVCDNGQTTAQCEGAPALMTREVPTWTTLQSTTAPTGHQLVWVQTERTMQDAQVYGDDDRRAVTTYALASDATTYRLREVETATFWNNLGADQLATRTTTGWDATYRYPVTKAVASTSNPADDLVTHTTYDSLTGNVLAVRKPQQYAASGVAAPATTYQYDVRKLFVVTTTNELGHVVDTVTEYGTGEVLFTKGPNVRQCTTCSGPMKEEHNVVRDALGRPLEEEEVTSPNGGEYTLWKVATHTYVDAPSGTISPHVIDRTLIDYVAGPNARWTETRTDVDGLGRPIRSTVEVDVADAPNDAVTTYDYDHRGKLVAVTVPDPSQNGTQTVTFTYEFDSLGRPTSMRRPDAATLAHRSGVDISYGPSTETRTEVPGIAGGPAASTETQRDAFGRMIAVSEQTGVGTWATTSYSFGPSGQVSLIDDPDGVVTAMEHDLAGRRTSITRGGRTWVYGYDRNGNMISERVPTVDQNASTLAANTTLHAYDVLDREVTRSVAPRTMSAADLTYFGVGTWTMTYDVGGIGGNGNKKGLLTSATAPGGVYTHQVTYDAQSNVTKDRRTFAMGGVSGTREWDATYLPGGKIDGFTYDDDATQAGNGARTKTKTYYDSRGLPEKVMWLRSDAGAWSVQLARHTRNVAGLVTKRWAPGGVPIAGQPAYPAMNAAYGYDAIGRLTSQVVTSGSTGSGGTQLARQDVAYWGSDDPKTLEHRLWPTGGAAVYKKFEYGYDLRHQLASVGEVAAGGAYAAAMEYSNAGRIGRATIGGAAPPATTEVRARDVTHVYGDPVASPPEDQELLKALKVASGANVGADYATFEYDVVGNMTSRTLTALATGGAPETWTYEYDGEDQLRRVVGPGGAVEEYWYDEGGQRVAIKKRTGGVGGAFAGFRWMSGDVEVETNSTGAVVQKTFTNVSMGTPIARLENRGDTAAGSGGVFERQYHGLGSSTLASVDGVTGGSRVGFVYGAWGEVVEKVGAVGEVASHRRRWNDKYVDDVGGLAYYGARYYDGIALQWTQGDPLYRWKPDFAGGDPRRANLYVFSGQNSLRYTDPDGRNFVTIWETVIAGYSKEDQKSSREESEEKQSETIDTADALYAATLGAAGRAHLNVQHSAA